MKKKELQTKNPPGENLSRRGRRKAATRTRIVEAALDLLSRQEYNATTIEQITQAADVGKGTYFNYFASKEHLLNEVGQEQLTIIRTTVERALVSEENLKDVFKKLFFSLTKLFVDVPILARNLLLANLGNISARHLMEKSVIERAGWLEKLVKKGQETGEIRNDIKPELIAYWFLHTHFGNLLYWALELSTQIDNWLEITFEQFWVSVVPCEKKTATGGSLRKRQPAGRG